MTFIVAEECKRLGLRAGAILFRNVSIGPADATLRSAIVQEAQAVRTRFADAAAIRADPRVASFHEILRKVGANPRRDQPSIDRLLTYALKRGDLPIINNLVDAYNLVSIRSTCSLGAHDLDRIACPVSLRLLSGQESFTPLGRSESVAVIPGEYGYVDAANRLLCRLDVVQADFSKVTHETRNVLLIVEGTTAHAPEVLQQTFEAVIEQARKACGGVAEKLR